MNESNKLQVAPVDPCGCSEKDMYVTNNYGRFQLNSTTLSETEFVDKMLELLTIARTLGFTVRNFSVENY